jgi:glutamate dehydrogenase
MPDRHLGADEMRAAQTLISRAAETAAAHEVPAELTTALFAGAAPEDLLRYRPDDLSRFAADAWAFLAQRPPGTAKVSFHDISLTPAAAGEPGAVGIIEIANDDMPFLVDSVMSEIAEQGLTVRLVTHPLLAVERPADGKLTAFHGLAHNGSRESFIHIHVDPVADRQRRAVIAAQIESVLADVRIAVADWRAMQTRVKDAAAQLQAAPPPLPADEIAEAVEFANWLCADNFTFLGVRDYLLTADGLDLKPVPDSGLGILRSSEMHVLHRGDDTSEVTPEITAFLKEPKLLIVTKANMRSRVHRRVYLDYVGIKRFGA